MRSPRRTYRKISFRPSFRAEAPSPSSNAAARRPTAPCRFSWRSIARSRVPYFLRSVAAGADASDSSVRSAACRLGASNVDLALDEAVVVHAGALDEPAQRKALDDQCREHGG